jgi:tyrosine aminotransferase
MRGISEVRKKIAEQYSNELFKVSEDDVFLTFGVSLSLWIVIATLADSGDNFLVPSPGFPLAVTIASNLGIKVKYYELIEEKDWEVDLNKIE